MNVTYIKSDHFWQLHCVTCSQADIDPLGCSYPQSVKPNLILADCTESSEYDNIDRAHRWTQTAPKLELLCNAEDVIWKSVLLYLTPTSELSDTQSLMEVHVLLNASCRNAQTAALSMGCDNCNRCCNAAHLKAHPRGFMNSRVSPSSLWGHWYGSDQAGEEARLSR